MDNIILLALRGEAPAMAEYSNVFFTGVGKVNAALTIARLLERHRPQVVWNFGTAGGTPQPGQLYQVGSFVQRDMMATQLGFAPGETPFDEAPVTLRLGEGLTCGSGDSFVTGGDNPLPTDLVDMEAYALAKACWLAGVEFRCFKYISDAADEEAAQNWEKMQAAGEPLYMEKARDILVR